MTFSSRGRALSKCTCNEKSNCGGLITLQSENDNKFRAPGPKEFVAARPFENVELSLPYPSAPVWGRAKATGTRTVRRNGLTLMGWGWGGAGL
jgi:hypothetical protein